MKLNRLQKEEARLVERLAKVRAAIEIWHELDGGASADAKVKQLGKLVKASKPVVAVAKNGQPYKRRPREQWEPQLLAFIREHPGCNSGEIAQGMHVGKASIGKQLRDLSRERLLTRRRGSGSGTQFSYTVKT